MSTTIDERVVEMRFDNRQFEAGVKTSLSTLDKLKEGLDLDGAARGHRSYQWQLARPVPSVWQRIRGIPHTLQLDRSVLGHS